MAGEAPDRLLRRVERQFMLSLARERERIGADLHDTLCQELVGTAFLAGQLHARLAAERHADAELAGEIGRLLAASARRARDIAGGLHPVVPAPDYLTEAVSDYARASAAEAGVACVVRCPRKIVLLDRNTCTQLFLIAREAIRNAVRHSAARRLRVCLAESRTALRISVCDDGKGLPAARPRSDSMGLAIMKARADWIGATLRIGRSRGRGTTMECTWPKPQRRQREEPAC